MEGPCRATLAKPASSDYTSKCGDHTYVTSNVCKYNCDEIEVSSDDVATEVCQKCSKLKVEVRRMRNEVGLLKIVWL